VHLTLAKANQQRLLKVILGNSSKGNNWVRFFDFIPSETDRRKTKNLTWSDDEGGAEHKKTVMSRASLTNALKPTSLHKVFKIEGGFLF